MHFLLTSVTLQFSSAGTLHASSRPAGEERRASEEVFVIARLSAVKHAAADSLHRRGLPSRLLAAVTKTPSSPRVTQPECNKPTDEGLRLSVNYNAVPHLAQPY